MNLLSPPRALALLLAAAGTIASVACGSQAPTDYEGEALATVNGTVVNPANAALPPMDAALVWGEDSIGLSDGGFELETTAGIVASRVAVSSTFPADFTLSVFTPPPAGKLFPCDPNATDGPQVALASIVGLRRGADSANVQDSDILAYGRDTVVYADSDIPANVACQLVLRPALKKGYNLIGEAGFALSFSSSRITLSIASSAGAATGADEDCLPPGSSVTLPAGATGAGMYADALFPADAGCPQPWTATSWAGPNVPWAECTLPPVPTSGWINGSCADSTVPGFCIIADPDGEPTQCIVLSAPTPRPGGSFSVTSQ